ncbi:MAG: hypothetical protein VX444_14810 [Pseudomonadota bacterium]|nr:hypothetical protein [Pseudomonadota bacterium]
MKKFALATALCVAAGSVSAGSTMDTAPMMTTTDYDPTFFAGFTWSIGGAVSAASGSNPFGFSLRYLSTNEPDKLAGAIGVTYFFDGTFGCDIGGGLNNGGGSLVFAYDFCRNAPVISIGGIKKPDTTTMTYPTALTAATAE